jgi:hypothetical protein
LHSSVLERTESDLSKINWLRGVILLHPNSVGALGQVSIVSHSYHIYFDFPELDLNLDCGLHDYVITKKKRKKERKIAKFTKRQKKKSREKNKKKQKAGSKVKIKEKIE